MKTEEEEEDEREDGLGVEERLVCVGELRTDDDTKGSVGEHADKAVEDASVHEVTCRRAHVHATVFKSKDLSSSQFSFEVAT